MVFCFVSLAIAVMVWGLLWDMNVTIRLDLCRSSVRLEVRARFFFRRATLRHSFYGDTADSAALLTGARHDPLLRLLFVRRHYKKDKRARLHLPAGSIRLQSLRCVGSVGCADALCTALLTGVLRIAASLYAAPQGADLHAAVAPDFSGSGCRLILEGIFRLRVTHIIKAVVRQKAKRKGEKQYAASD